MSGGPITIVLMGEPVPFARSGHNGRQHFTPAKQRNTAAALRIVAQQAMHEANLGNAIFDEPLSLNLHAEFSIPTGWSQRKRAAAIAGVIRPGKRPDIDNLYKLAADALNTVVYRDDALIVEVYARKVYGVEPKLIVTVQPISAGQAQMAA